MTRSQIVAAAREYVGTPFQHQGRLKGFALDCVGLVLSVGEDVGAVDTDGKPFLRGQYPSYSSQPLDAFVHEECKRRMFQMDAPLKDGDVITLRVPRVPCHVAIVSSVGGVLHMIHAYAGNCTKTFPNGACVEHVLDSKWSKRIEGVFEFPGVTNG